MKKTVRLWELLGFTAVTVCCLTLSAVVAVSPVAALESQSESQTDDDYEKLITKVRNSGIIERIRSDAKGYVDKATSFLDFFPRSSIKENLEAFGEYMIKRSF